MRHLPAHVRAPASGSRRALVKLAGGRGSGQAAYRAAGAPFIRPVTSAWRVFWFRAGARSRARDEASFQVEIPDLGRVQRRVLSGGDEVELGRRRRCAPSPALCGEGLGWGCLHKTHQSRGWTSLTRRALRARRPLPQAGEVKGRRTFRRDDPAQTGARWWRPDPDVWSMMSIEPIGTPALTRSPFRAAGGGRYMQRQAYSDDGPGSLRGGYGDRAADLRTKIAT